MAQDLSSDPIGVSAGSANPRARAVAVPGATASRALVLASGCMHSSVPHGRARSSTARAPAAAHGDQRSASPFSPNRAPRSRPGTQRHAGHGQPRHRSRRSLRAEDHTFSPRPAIARHRADEPHARFDLAAAVLLRGSARPRGNRHVVELPGQGPLPSSCCATAALHANVGKAEALLRRPGPVFEIVGEMWRPCCAPSRSPGGQRAISGGETHAAQSAAQATASVCETAGTTSIVPRARWSATRATLKSYPSQPAACELRAVGRHRLAESNSPCSRQGATFRPIVRLFTEAILSAISPARPSVYRWSRGRARCVTRLV